MGIIMDGKALAQKIKEQIKKDVFSLQQQNIYPSLAVILVGNDEASLVYTKNKEKACEEVGINYQLYHLEENTSKEDLASLIIKLNNDKKTHGILVQSPIPNQINYNAITDLISKDKDVDGFNTYNIGKLYQNEINFTSCTVLGIIELFNYYNIDLEGQNVVVIGRSNIVGKPLANYLINQSATVTVCHSKTKNLKDFTQKADILISATGQAHLIKSDMVNEKAIVIDVGITRNNGKLTGDVDFENIKDKAAYITPVPGGVGPLTVAMLLKSIIKAASKEKEENNG